MTTTPPDDAAGRARDALLTMLAARAPGATICPSEVARRLASGTGTAGWRDLMPAVHDAVDALVGDGAVRLSWKGETLASRSGPYRIGRGQPG